MRARDLVRDRPRVRAGAQAPVPHDLNRRISGHRSDPVRDSALSRRAARQFSQGLAQGQAHAGKSLRRRRSQAVDLRLSPRRHRGLSRSRRENHQGAGRHRMPPDHELPQQRRDSRRGQRRVRALIQAQDGLQPPYIAIQPAPGRKSAGRATARKSQCAKSSRAMTRRVTR